MAKEQDRVAALEQENSDLKRVLAGVPPPMRQPGQDATLRDCHAKGVPELGSLQTREVQLTPPAAATVILATEGKTK